MPDRPRTVPDIHAPSSRRPLTFVLTGARGFVGEALVPFLTAGGHTVRRLVRGEGALSWDATSGRLDPALLAGADVVVHLSGEPINQRWTAASKREIIASRIRSTTLIAHTLAGMNAPPALLCASAVGYYGHRGDAWVDEDDPPGEGFAAEVCQAWEAACAPAREAGVRVVNLRIGVVLSARGGALSQMVPPFRWGVGGVIGSGRQYVPWIALDDLLGMILWVAADDVHGVVNATAPAPVPMAQFAATLGATLGRPVWVPIPAFAVRLALGEMGERLILEGARVRPSRALAAGFPFRFAELSDALRAELGP